MESRVTEDRLLLDLRTVEPSLDATLLSLLRGIAQSEDDPDLQKDEPRQFPLQACAEE